MACGREPLFVQRSQACPATRRRSSDVGGPPVRCPELGARPPDGRQVGAAGCPGTRALRQRRAWPVGRCRVGWVSGMGTPASPKAKARCAPHPCAPRTILQPTQIAMPGALALRPRFQPPVPRFRMTMSAMNVPKPETALRGVFLDGRHHPATKAPQDVARPSQAPISAPQTGTPEADVVGPPSGSPAPRSSPHDPASDGR